MSLEQLFLFQNLLKFPGEPGVCVCQNVDSILLINPGPQPRIRADDYNSDDGYGGSRGGGDRAGYQGYGRK